MMLQLPRSGTWVVVTTRPQQDCGIAPGTMGTLCVARLTAREGELHSFSSRNCCVSCRGSNKVEVDCSSQVTGAGLVEGWPCYEQ